MVTETLYGGLMAVKVRETKTFASLYVLRDVVSSTDPFSTVLNYSSPETKYFQIFDEHA